MAFSTYLADNLLDHVLRGGALGTAFPQFYLVYLAMHTEDPTPAGTGAEMTGGSYSRLYCPFSGSPVNGSISNGLGGVWTNLPTGLVTHLSLWDASSGGNMLFYDELPTPIPFNSGDGATVQVGAITVVLN